MKIHFEVCPCPWCKVTPKFCMDLDAITWVPHLECINSLCNVQPKSKYVSIRKTSKTSPPMLLEKMKTLFGRWNNNNPVKAYEAMEFDFEEIVRKEAERKK